MCDLAVDGPVIYHGENNVCAGELLRPNIVTPLPLQTSGKAGSEVKLLCLLTGYPPLELSWYLNGEEIHATENGRISFNNHKRLLIIKDLKTTDGGSITFEAKNKYGEVSSNCFLEVIVRRDSKYGNHSPKPIRRLMHVLNRMKSF